MKIEAMNTFRMMINDFAGSDDALVGKANYSEHSGGIKVTDRTLGWKIAAPFRSSTEKAENTAVRQRLIDALCTTFGLETKESSMETLEKLLGKKVFNRDDFGTLSQHGEVSSTRPLTARRVRAIVNRVTELKVAEDTHAALRQGCNEAMKGMIALFDEADTVKTEDFETKANRVLLYAREDLGEEKADDGQSLKSLLRKCAYEAVSNLTADSFDQFKEKLSVSVYVKLEEAMRHGADKWGKPFPEDAKRLLVLDALYLSIQKRVEDDKVARHEAEKAALEAEKTALEEEIKTQILHRDANINVQAVTLKSMPKAEIARRVRSAAVTRAKGRQAAKEVKVLEAKLAALKQKIEAAKNVQEPQKFIPGWM